MPNKSARAVRPERIRRQVKAGTYETPDVRCEDATVVGACLMILSAVGVVVAALWGLVG